MTHRVAILSFSFIFLLGLSTSLLAEDKEVHWETPIIQGIGHVNPLPDAALKPDPKHQYKMLFDVTKGSAHPSAMNGSLAKVARTVNLYGTVEDFPMKNLHVAVVIHGGATSSILNGKSYKDRFGVANPNDHIIKVLSAAGVKIYVCGQAIADFSYPYEDVRSDVTVVLGALAAETALESQEGYVKFVL